jgi:hypothetical protein
LAGIGQRWLGLERVMHSARLALVHGMHYHIPYLQ